MRSTLFTAIALTGSVIVVSIASAQTPLIAPAGWKSGSISRGTTVLTPPDLKKGEVFTVAVFDPTPLGGRPLEEWLRDFAGPVGSDPGTLTAPLKITTAKGKVIAGTGLYAGPRGTSLAVLFFGTVSDSGSIHVVRVLTSTAGNLLARYKEPLEAINRTVAARAHGVTSGASTSAKGAAARPDRSAERAAKAAAAAETKRYKYVTAPGKGVQPGQITGILHTTELEFAGTATNAVSGVYLLLSDGTTRKGLPVVLDQLDVAGSRRAEPQEWGRWRRQGSKIQIAMADEKGVFKTMDGVLVKPGKSGQRLQGRFGTGSSSSYAFGAGSYRLWGVTFTKDGRFVKDSRGGASGSDAIPDSGQVSVNTTYDDKGSVTSASGGGVAVSASKKKSSSGDRAGTYSINGYTLTLRYDNGQVARMPFFFLDDDLDNLWFEDALLGLSKKKGKGK